MFPSGRNWRRTFFAYGPKRRLRPMDIRFNLSGELAPVGPCCAPSPSPATSIGGSKKIYG
jgi:hypothetical protein